MTPDADQQVRGALFFPEQVKVRVAVFARATPPRPQAAGAEYVGAEDLVAKSERRLYGFRYSNRIPDMMGLVGRLGRFWVRGLMPSPKATVTLMSQGC